MKKTSKTPRTKPRPDMRPEYDFSKGVRGKYAAHFAEGTNVVVLDPDVADIFPTSTSVNEALRALAKIIRSTRSRGRRSRKSA
jgi:hypothetical protein